VREQEGQPVLQGKRVLVVEDDYLIAAQLASDVAEAGCNLVGMANTVDAALDIIATVDVDAAVVNVKLRQEQTFRVADALAARHIPFAFVTGLSRNDAPARYANVPWLEKPFAAGTLRRVLEGVMQPAQQDGC
jgi:DNA-binding response OmpR family regulator